MPHMIARQLTAFLPPDFPLQEEPSEGDVTPGKRRKGKMRILLLENINVDAADFLKASGFEVSCVERDIEKS
jgi:D-3-phosphoglycerate dehydrogenase